MATDRSAERREARGPLDDPGSDFLVRLGEDELDALVEAMALVAFADGCYSEPEKRRFVHNVARLTGGQIGAERFDHVLERVEESLRRDGLLRCAATLRGRLCSVELRSVALILASDMAAADGVLHPAERTLLHALADAFHIPAEQRRALIDGFL